MNYHPNIIRIQDIRHLVLMIVSYILWLMVNEFLIQLS